MKVQRNYLNNKDLLSEIHKSKTSYCSFIDETDNDYDIILENLDKVNIRTVAKAKRNKAEKLKNITGDEIKWKNIKKEELVFRIMTYDHIPTREEPKKNIKTVADLHIQCNFPPFQHYRYINEELICVGKSHWIGGMKNGHFSKDHGKITDKLAKMFMKLTERYAMRSNWRNYTYNDDMQNSALLQLSQSGLQFDENRSQNPFAYYTTIITNSFTRILNIEKKNQDIRDDLLENHGMSPSYTRQLSNEKNKT